MFEEKDGNLDDLIGGNQRPIIVERSGNDKKFLYTLLILLVVLFLIALGLIAFLGSKYFGGNSNTVPVKQEVQANAKSGKSIEKVMSQSYEKPKVANTHTNNTQAPKQAKTDNSAVNELEQLVKTQKKAKPKTVVEKSITKVAKSSGKGLSQEELATIAKLVAQELAKNKVVAKAAATQTTQKTQVQKAAPQSDAALVASLQQASTDTLKESNINASSVKSSNVKASNSNKKIDTFNKVVVQQKANKNDDLAKLSSEIDTILQSEDVQKHKQNLKYKKVLDKEANVRAKELRFIVVKKGDTLSSIAYRAYGRASDYIKIYKANPDLVKNPNRIYIGMRLRVPVDSEYKTEGN